MDRSLASLTKVTGADYVGNHGSGLLVRSNGTNAFVKAGTPEPVRQLHRIVAAAL